MPSRALLVFALLCSAALSVSSARRTSPRHEDVQGKMDSARCTSRCLTLHMTQLTAAFKHLQNRALCRSRGNGYACFCVPGFQGARCQIDVNECISRPCLNGATCVDGVGRFTCLCPPGVTGSTCQLQIDECQSQPCLNGGSCHDTGVHGFACTCPPGFHGDRCSLCQGPVDPCESSPCQNGGSCEPQVGGYTCRCPTQSPDGLLYGGAHCHVPLNGCRDHRCQNWASCRPFLSEIGQRHGYSCSCPPGFTGPLCGTTTAFSFRRGGSLLLRRHNHSHLPLDSDDSCNVTLSFRTTLLQAGLFRRGSVHGGGLLLSLERGRPRLTLRKTLLDGPPQQEEKKAEEEEEEGSQSQTLEVQRYVADGEWHSVEVLLGRRTLGLKLLDDAGSCQGAEQGCRGAAAVQSTLAGPLLSMETRLVLGLLGEDASGPADAHAHTDADPPPPSFVGCMRDVLVDGELIVPGVGLDDITANVSLGCSQWDRCVDAPCHNGGQCVNLETSHHCRCPRPYRGAHCEQDYLGQDLAISLFLRTTPADGAPTGRCPGGVLSDGEVHFVSVEVVGWWRAVTLLVGDERQDYALQGTPLLDRYRPGDRVYVGGLREEMEAEEEEEEGSASAFGGHFKGCLQDLRINDQRLQFFGLETAARSFPLEATSNAQPCLNGGLCLSTWDDFSCACPVHTAGRAVRRSGGARRLPARRLRVQDAPPGYECYGNVSILNDSSVLRYQGNGHISRDITSLSLSLRNTHTPRRPAARRERLRLHHRLPPGWPALRGAAEPRGRRARGAEGGGGGGGVIRTPPLVAWSWTGTRTRPAPRRPRGPAAGSSLNFLRRDVDIFLGGLAPGTGWGLRSSKEEEEFVRTSGAPPRAGCTGAAVCQPNPCLNGGLCRDLFNLHRCGCPRGWAGRYCGVSNTDACASGPCVHGNCSVGGLGYECACDFGYAGATCEAEADVCEGHLCAHGATCLQGPDRYACLCAENYTGPFAMSVLKRPTRLPVSICGDNTRNYTCFNGGNCSDRQLSCDCPPGFTGHRCEQEVDECKSNPCLNGGYCRNLVNRFACVCDMSFAGDVCQTDVSDIYFYVAVLLWQNLFQLLSYLILRLDDDEPHLDWGGEDE
ncbi:hypothetical protein CRUP_037136 [Coryphaenoides rupestris]|nr:hypothetical protein CRUP_037136 [Coryphaenoides rupestris]